MVATVVVVQVVVVVVVVGAVGGKASTPPHMTVSVITGEKYLGTFKNVLLLCQTGHSLVNTCICW